MFEVRKTSIPGCFELLAEIRGDERGSFFKTYHEEFFRANGLATDFREEFYSVSRKGVLRGLHFQSPPAEHAKLVSCLGGKVLDAVVDLRKGSPTFGRHQLFTLAPETANLVYIPAGLAHGFYVVEGDALMSYKVTSVHSPEHDTGIRWDSAGIPWPDGSPLISARDSALPRLETIESPFQFSGGLQ
jgi:dTDP-4-dehydrorhamnose 3,5-epimerase